MNPWALLVILLGLVLIIIGTKGSQHDVVSAITGKSSTSNQTSNQTSPPTQNSGSAQNGNQGGSGVRTIPPNVEA
jgi:hypothetical protein